jgi:hypothetical protein
MASLSNETAADNACQHTGRQSSHRFTYNFTTAQRSDFKGQPIYIFGIGDETPHRLLDNSGQFVVPAIDPRDIGNTGTLKGRACIETASRSVYVEIFADDRQIRTVLTNQPGADLRGSNAIAAQCKHSGTAGNHRFTLTFTDTEMATFAGKKLSARVRETETWLSNSWKHRMPGEISHLYYDNTFPNSERDRLKLTWDYANTAQRNTINGTLLGFAGRTGNAYGLSEPHVKEVEKVLGQACVRVIRVDVNPGSDTVQGGSIG